MSEKTIIRWNISVPRILDDAVERAIELDMHSTKSDLVRDAVRQKLEEMGFKSTPFQQIDDGTASPLSNKGSRIKKT
jgi:Arc/MetJ-type ribon-helix-helix transcriptional regulator